MFKLVENREKNEKEQRMVIVETLQELMKTDDAIVVLEADLGAASGFHNIRATNPERFIQCGIAEANMVGVAAGLSLLGFKPFLHSFSPFITRRCFDQIYVSGAYAQNTLYLFGSDPGFTAAHNGGTHTTWEDIALLRTIPNTTILDPCDAVQLAWTVKKIIKAPGIYYVRSNRKAVRNVYTEDSTFALGKGNIVRKGNDVLIIAAGEIVSEALDAAEQLEKKGWSVEVIDMFTIKPLDKDLILREVVAKRMVITFENHSVVGGLGSAVEELLCANAIAVRFKKMGVKERFGQVGSADFLQEEYHLKAKDILESEVFYEDKSLY